MTDNTIVWNVRELGRFKGHLRRLIGNFDVAIVAILELFKGENRMPRLASFLGFQNFCCNEA